MTNGRFLAIVAVLVMAGGFMATYTLRLDDSDSSYGSEEAAFTGADDESEVDIRKQKDGSGARPRLTQGRKFSRGRGAAELQVTPTVADRNGSESRPRVRTTAADIALARHNTMSVIVESFRNEPLPDKRVNLANELGLIEEREAAEKLLELLQMEQDPRVQRALLDGLYGSTKLKDIAPEVYRVVLETVSRATEPEVYSAALDVVRKMDPEEAALFMASVYADDNIRPEARVSAAANLLTISRTRPDMVSEKEVSAINQQIWKEYQTSNDVAARTLAIKALEVYAQENVLYFQQALESEQDPELRKLLERLARMAD